MTPLRPAERRLYQQVADQIRGLIQSGDFASGDRLPAERELALQLGVSRPSLREALIALEIEGAVEIRMGSGIYVVSAAKTRSPRSAAIGESPVELMQARAAVEGAVTLLAAPKITPEALTSLHRTLESMRTEIAQDRTPIEHDRQFHMLIAEQSGNHVLSRIVGDLFDERHSPISSQIRSRFETRDTWRLAVAEHQAILEALELRDALLAQAMMHAHLEQSKRRWLENDPR